VKHLLHSLLFVLVIVAIISYLSWIGNVENDSESRRGYIQAHILHLLQLLSNETISYIELLPVEESSKRFKYRIDSVEHVEYVHQLLQNADKVDPKPRSHAVFEARLIFLLQSGRKEEFFLTIRKFDLEHAFLSKTGRGVQMEDEELTLSQSSRNTVVRVPLLGTFFLKIAPEARAKFF